MTTEFNPDYAVRPGATLLDVMNDRDWNCHELSAVTGISVVVLLDILTVAKPITPEIAEGLERGTVISADFWLNRERQYRQLLASGTVDAEGDEE